jgi:hypothetical protein
MSITQSPIILSNFGTAQGWSAGFTRIVVDADLSNANPGDSPALYAPDNRFNPNTPPSLGDRDYGADIVGFGANNVIIGYGGVWGPGDAGQTGEGFRVFAPNTLAAGPNGSFITAPLENVPGLHRGADLAAIDPTADLDPITPGDQVIDGEATITETPGTAADPSNDLGVTVWAQTSTGFEFYSPTHTSRTIVDTAGHNHYVIEYQESSVVLDTDGEGASQYGSEQGWTSAHNVQVAFADRTSDTYASIFGFGENGIVVTDQAFSQQDVDISETYLTGSGWGNAQGYNETRDIRTVTDYLGHEVDLNDDGITDVVGMGPSGLVFSYGVDVGGRWETGLPTVSQANFGELQGWTKSTTERMLADVNNDGELDAVGFGVNGVIVAWGQAGLNPFADAQFNLANFGSAQGWNTANHVRALGDVDDDGDLDIVGFGENGTYVSLFDNDTDTWAQPSEFFANLGVAQGWSTTQHVRTLADVDQDGAMDIIAMGANGTSVWNISVPPLVVET